MRRMVGEAESHGCAPLGWCASSLLQTRGLTSNLDLMFPSRVITIASCIDRRGSDAGDCKLATNMVVYYDDFGQ